MNGMIWSTARLGFLIVSEIIQLVKATLYYIVRVQMISYTETQSCNSTSHASLNLHGLLN